VEHDTVISSLSKEIQISQVRMTNQTSVLLVTNNDDSINNRLPGASTDILRPVLSSQPSKLLILFNHKSFDDFRHRENVNARELQTIYPPWHFKRDQEDRLELPKVYSNTAARRDYDFRVHPFLDSLVAEQ
jgi:hypothetical protein